MREKGNVAHHHGGAELKTPGARAVRRRSYRRPHHRGRGLKRGSLISPAALCRSPPSRGRGIENSFEGGKVRRAVLSPPSRRARIEKHPRSETDFASWNSRPPSRGRGLKHAPCHWAAPHARVAPPSRGARIETRCSLSPPGSPAVAAHHGRRGLKPGCQRRARMCWREVAPPITGARIETGMRLRPVARAEGRPHHGGAGLKTQTQIPKETPPRSPPITGARIET